jgi:hypothetical protein
LAANIGNGRGIPSGASNEIDWQALTVMAKRKPDRPMVMQPVAHDLTAPTPMLPVMPAAGAGREAKVSAVNKKHSTRTDAMRTAKARISRRNSLRKQRYAQKTA